MSSYYLSFWRIPILPWTFLFFLKCPCPSLHKLWTVWLSLDTSSFINILSWSPSNANIISNETPMSRVVTVLPIIFSQTSMNIAKNCDCVIILINPIVCPRSDPPSTIPWLNQIENTWRHSIQSFVKPWRRGPTRVLYMSGPKSRDIDSHPNSAISLPFWWDISLNTVSGSLLNIMSRFTYLTHISRISILIQSTEHITSSCEEKVLCEHPSFLIILKQNVVCFRELLFSFLIVLFSSIL